MKVYLPLSSEIVREGVCAVDVRAVSTVLITLYAVVVRAVSAVLVTLFDNVPTHTPLPSASVAGTPFT